MKMKNKVVAVCGAKSSGKDSYFKYMQENLHGGVELINAKFAEPLNEFLDELVGEVPYFNRDCTLMIGRVHFLGLLEKHFPYLHEPSIITDFFHMSWRELAEWVGTTLVRGSRPDTFIDKLDEKYMDVVKDPNGNCVLVLTDVRFKNELEMADIVVLLKREDDLRTEFSSETPEPEKMGEMIAVYLNRYMIAGDNRFLKAKDFLSKLKRELNLFEDPHLYQTMLDADGELMFDDVKYAMFGGDSSQYDVETIERWFEELSM